MLLQSTGGTVRQLEEFARRTGGQVVCRLKRQGAADGVVVDIPDVVVARGEWFSTRNPGLRLTHDLLDLPAQVCNGELFLDHECVWDRYPSGRPFTLQATTVD